MIHVRGESILGLFYNDFSMRRMFIREPHLSLKLSKGDVSGALCAP